jgi:16S rRNA A1518/A1519 N6-dimethyltransferase RsmA/KsgA/DIM1 with predicted DNA glycosylase/AP lyase activity
VRPGLTSSSKSDRRSRGRRHALGQHYLTDPSVVRSIIELAAIQRAEKVLEIGTGRGALTRELVGIADHFEGYEVDKESYEALSSEMTGTSLVLHNEDAFKSSPEFDVLLSSLPYSESSAFVEWLSRRKYDRAVLLLQRDFATKITAPPSSPVYRAVSVISQASAKVEIVSNVSRLSFDPPPRVNSCLVTMKWRRTLSAEQNAMIKKIFSQKRRTVRAALKSLGLPAPASAPTPSEHEYLQCRVNSLRPESVIAMIEVLSRAEQARSAQR